MDRRKLFKMTAALTAVFAGGSAAKAALGSSRPLAGRQKPLDIEDIRKWVDPGATVVTTPDEGVPQHWRGYLSPDHARRLRHMESELALFEAVFPQTARAFRDVTRDAFVIRLSKQKYGQRFARVFKGLATYDSAPDSDLYSFLSYSVSQSVMADEKNRLFLERAPEALSHLYRTLFDGIADVWGDGLQPLEHMATVAAKTEVYEEAGWYDGFVAKTNPALVYETIQNGAGVNGLIDLNDASVAHSPKPVAIWTDSKEPDFELTDFWNFNDTLLAIIISGR